jgi:hypothetical protein
VIKFDQETSRKNVKIKRLYNINTANMDCKNKSDTSSNTGDGTISTSYRKYLSNMPGKHEIKAYKNSHISHCTHTSKSANVKV